MYIELVWVGEPGLLRPPRRKRYACAGIETASKCLHASGRTDTFEIEFEVSVYDPVQTTDKFAWKVEGASVIPGLPYCLSGLIPGSDNLDESRGIN